MVSAWRRNAPVRHGPRSACWIDAIACAAVKYGVQKPMTSGSRAPVERRAAGSAAPADAENLDDATMRRPACRRDKRAAAESGLRPGKGIRRQLVRARPHTHTDTMPAIPKILHFCWKSEDLPRVMRRYFEKWQRLHGDWDVRLWTDETMRGFVTRAYPRLLPVYDGYPKMIQRADAFRYLVLNRLGGVYADLDVEPLAPIDPLLEGGGFLGVEPLEHVASDRIHAGLPFQLTNAFMGAAPEHPLFASIVKLLPELKDQAIFYSTGPAMVTAAYLRLPPAERPRLLLPKVWSPLRDGGRPTRGDARLREMLAGVGPIEECETTLVSHKWMTTWVKWHQRYTPLQDVGQLPSRAKWWVRRRFVFKALGAVTIPDPLRPYTDQRPEPSPEVEPIFVGVRLDGGRCLHPELAAALRGLDYPAEALTFGFDSDAGREERAAVERSIRDEFGAAAEVVFAAAHPFLHPVTHRAGANNRLLARAAARTGRLLLVGGGVRQVPADALRRLLGAGRPVMAPALRDESGEPDISVFRYNWGPDFRTLYKLDGTSGQVRRDRHFRYVPDDQRAFPLFALDGVGDDFVLIERAVIAAGIRFAETPYKLHLNGEGFAIMARDRGFEAAALTGLVVSRQGGAATTF